MDWVKTFGTVLLVTLPTTGSFVAAAPLFVQFNEFVSQRLLTPPPQAAAARLGPLVTTSQITLVLSLEMIPVKLDGNVPTAKATPLPLPF